MINVSKSVITSRWRVLVTALSIMCITGNSFVAYGYTSDDVRELVGQQRLDDERYVRKLNDIVKIRERAVEIGDMAAAINEIASENDEDEKLNEAKNKLENLKSELKLLENSMAAPNEILGIIKQIESVNTELSKLDIGLSEFTVDADDTKYEEEYNFAIDKLQYINDNFELGEVGSNTPNPYGSKDMSLYEPYGDIRETYNLDNIYHNNGIYIKKPGDKYDSSYEHVRSIYNGTVVGVVENDPNWGSYVTIRHGKGLETSYSFLSKVNVIVGQEIKQGSAIGESNNSYIYLEVKLDGNYINPIYLFGKQGANAYSSWISENNERAESKIDISDIQVYLNNKTDE